MLVAVTVMVLGFGREAGGVYRPAILIVPKVAFPPATPLTAQRRRVSVVPVTVAVNCCVTPSVTLTLEGATFTVTPGVETGFDPGSRLQPARPMAIALTSKKVVQRVCIGISSSVELSSFYNGEDEWRVLVRLYFTEL